MTILKNLAVPRTALLAIGLAVLALPAAAHPGHAHAADALGFGAGFVHPFTGVDHLLAMLGVGLWSGQQRKSAGVPLVFLLMMLVGAVSGVAGLTIPGLEIGIAASVALTGVAIALATPMPAGAAMALAAVFAVLHGNAHGHELPQLQSAAGFLIASALLLGTGRVVGQWLTGRVLRVGGALIATAGLVLMGLNQG